MPHEEVKAPVSGRGILVGWLVVGWFFAFFFFAFSHFFFYHGRFLIAWCMPAGQNGYRVGDHVRLGGELPVCGFRRMGCWWLLWDMGYGGG